AGTSPTSSGPTTGSASSTTSSTSSGCPPARRPHGHTDPASPVTRVTGGGRHTRIGDLGSELSGILKGILTGHHDTQQGGDHACPDSSRPKASPRSRPSCCRSYG